MQPGYQQPPPAPPAYSQYPPGHIQPVALGGPVGPPPEVWMPVVSSKPDCPPGLEYLTMLDQVLIKQKTHMLEVLLDWECANKYKVLNNQGQQCYYAFEKSNVLCRQ